MRKNQSFTAMCFLAPYLIIFFIFRLLPSFASIYISLTKWSIVGQPTFIGLKNYIALFKDNNFFKALVNNIYFLLLILPVLIVLSLLTAITLNEKIPGRNVVRTIAIIPYVMIPAVVGIMWNWIYDANFGILNYVLSIFGGPSKSTMTLLQYQYISGFERQQLGYGSAVGVLTLVFLIGLVRLQSLIFKTEEEVK